MDIKIFRTLEEIDRKLWDSIIPSNSITKSYNFLLSVEQSMHIENQYWYILIFNHNELIAHTSLFTYHTKLEEVTKIPLPASFISKIRSCFPDFLTIKLLGCGTPIATCSDILTIKDLKYSNEVIKRLNDVICDIGKRQKVSMMMIRDFNDSLDGKVAHLKLYGYKKIESLPTSFVEIKWDNFEEYVDSYKSKIKVKMRRNLKRFYCNDIEVKLVDDFEPYVADMIKLYYNVYEKAEYKFEKLNEEFLRCINLNLGNKSKAIIVYKRHEIIGIELIVEDEDILRPLYVGLDYKYNEEHRLYFNMIYQIIKVGIELKKKYVELGQTCYYPKLKAGAEIGNLHMYIRFRNNLFNKILGDLLYTMFADFAFKEKDMEEVR